MYHHDLSKLFAKLEKKIADDNIKRQKAIESACNEYSSEEEIQNAWGYAFITAAERDRLLKIMWDADGEREDMALLKYRKMLAKDIRSIKEEMEEANS
jgi:hypothetical protein